LRDKFDTLGRKSWPPDWKCGRNTGPRRVSRKSDSEQQCSCLSLTCSLEYGGDGEEMHAHVVQPRCILFQHGKPHRTDLMRRKCDGRKEQGNKTHIHWYNGTCDDNALSGIYRLYVSVGI
jgi:hypothetical protein